MKKYSLLLLLSAFALGISCHMSQDRGQEKIADVQTPIPKDPFHRLCQYWEVTDADRPSYRDLFDQQVQGVFNYPGIIFLTDSTVVENPRSAMRYGQFSYKGRVITVHYDDGTQSVYTITKEVGDSMTMERKDPDHTTILHLKGDQIFWPDSKVNPFNRSIGWWMKRPSKPEADSLLRKRLKACVRFYQYYFQGEARTVSADADFQGLPCCFDWYQGAIIVQGPSHLDKKWIACFYSEAQAMQARQLMQDMLVSNQYNWDKTQTNWKLQIADVLGQVYQKF
ncbi:MAG: hypothetical protein KGM98_07865 [Bacteroidota bacterium]|nr:hypothetical protein [Bacteroidota bacterium]